MVSFSVLIADLVEQEIHGQREGEAMFSEESLSEFTGLGVLTPTLRARLALI